MNNNDFISDAEAFVKMRLTEFDSSHNWWHIDRVRKLASYINKIENAADPFIIDLAALFHDVADSKFKSKNGDNWFELTETFLNVNGIDKTTIAKVIFIMRNISFSNQAHKMVVRTPELNVVQDADRLDAMGAIGIARAFNYGGFRNNEIYVPEETGKNIPSTINHFYEKLLLLKNLMNTQTGLCLAERRHNFMQLFLEEFYEEQSI